MRYHIIYRAHNGGPWTVLAGDMTKDEAYVALENRRKNEPHLEWWFKAVDAGLPGRGW